MTTASLRTTPGKKKNYILSWNLIRSVRLLVSELAQAKHVAPAFNSK